MRAQSAKDDDERASRDLDAAQIFARLLLIPDPGEMSLASEVGEAKK